MIRKNYFWVVALMIIQISEIYANNPSTPSVIYDFYNSMKALPTEQSASRAYDLQIKMQYCFLYGKENEKHNSNSGIKAMPNDFYYFGDKSRKTIESSTLYTQIFKNKAFSKGERLKVTNVIIKSSSFAQEVDLNRYKNENTPFIQTFVTRTFTLGSISVTYNDTVLTMNNLIYRFSNGIGDDSNEDLESLRALAAKFYSTGLYSKAFQTYEKIVSLDATNANAYYRLGILAFWHGKKCGLYSKNSARQKGIVYMEKAESLGFNRASQVLYYMLHPSSI